MAEGMLVRRARMWRRAALTLLTLLTLALLTSLFVGLSGLHPLKVFSALTSQLGLKLGPEVSEAERVIVFEVRLPRLLLASLVGSSLALAGVVFQAVFRNPMADPYVIGSSAGAALGASLAIVLGLGYHQLGAVAVQLSAFTLSLLTVLAVYMTARGVRGVSSATLLLSGIAFSILLSAVVSLLMVLAGEKLHALVFWLMGGFSYSEWRDVQTTLPTIALGSALTYLRSKKLNIMLLGDEEAGYLGVDVGRERVVLIALATLVTASAVSVSGLIGFVGLVAPHVMRLLVGPDHRILIPSSMLFGALFLTLCDSAARVMLKPAEVPVGVVTALLGGPFFLTLLLKRGRGYEW